MKVIDDGENLPVHNHQLNKGHIFRSVVLFEVHIENLCKSGENDLNLFFCKNFKRLLVLILKSSFIFKEKIGQADQINNE